MDHVGNYSHNGYYPYYGSKYCSDFTELMYLIIVEKNQSDGYSNIKKHLTDNIATINYCNEKGWTALMIACTMCDEWSSLKTIRLLLKKGADINIKNNKGRTVLSLMVNIVTANKFNIMDLLIDKGADINSHDNKNKTLLIHACKKELDDTYKHICYVLGKSVDPSIEENDSKTVCYLLDKGADPNIEEHYGKTALFYASIMKNQDKAYKISKTLIERGASIHHTNVYSNTVLIHLCMKGCYTNRKLVELFLDHRIDINFQNSYGYTALIYACCNIKNEHCIEIINFMLEKGANIFLKDNAKFTAFLFIFTNNCFNYVIPVMQVILDYGYDINYTNKSNNNITALMMAVKFANKDKNMNVINFLLDKGADLEFKDMHSWTALFYACRYSNSSGNIDAVKLLLEYGANINVNSIIGYTPLIIACQYADRESNIETVKLLLEHGADPNFIMLDKNTALSVAITCLSENRYEVVKLLLYYHADPNTCIYLNSDGNVRKYNLLVWIVKNIKCEKLDLLMLLIEHGANYSDIKRYIFQENLDSRDIEKFMNFINSMENIKLVKKKIIDCIPKYVPEIIFNTNSMISKLLNLKWTVSSSNYKDLITLKNLDIIDYLGVYDIDSLYNRILDMTKYAY
ncbi:putative ankyrin repeat protein [Acanthamoeba polyphaga mimivirus]|uniref:Ankyrin repeat protein n=1 Tax=Acanthamoeba polyphaga mimivirus Kroon TaxID=3069720 RepID=A0A0G2Y7R1_9VIRU|nr:putative ankyrin repeat protein [Acanthamoeba polyphaga mimivirus]AKI79857.1 putative ankyrin repeat protein [Acanthamoeba polyphaga mimivirus Kroon]